MQQLCHKMPVRFDSSHLMPPKKSSQGFLVADAFLTRAGIFTYKRADGSTVRELRHPDEVFKADSLASIGLIPLTNDHPAEPVTADNAKSLSVGVVGQPKRDGDKVRAQVIVQDAQTIALMRMTKKHQISMGYTCDVVDGAGTWEGQAYDARQTNIEYNHAAIVNVGRAGPDVHLRMDSAETIYTETEDIPPMQKVRIDGVDFEVSEQAAQAFAKAQAESTKQAEQAAARADAAIAEVATLKTELAAAKDTTSLAKAVQARVALEKVAAKVITCDLAALSDSEIKRQVIAKKSPEAKLDGKSDTYVDARFDAVCEQLDRDTTTENLAPLAIAGQAAQHQDSGDKLSQALAAYHKRVQDAHKDAQ